MLDSVSHQDKSGWDWLHDTIEAAEAKLRETGLEVSSGIRRGDPRQVLPDGAVNWGVDAIFVGARGLSRLERIRLGSVSAAVAARALLGRGYTPYDELKQLRTESEAMPLTGTGMKIMMRLILLLALSVAALMIAEGYVSFRQSEAVVETTVRDELHAHALSLQITLEDQFSAGETAEAQRLIDHLSNNAQLYGALLFDERGQIVMASDPVVADKLRFPEEVRRVIATGIAGEIVRRINEQEILTIILPIRLSATRRGAFEIAQPLTLVEADLTGIRRSFIVTRSALVLAILLGMLVVMYQMSARLNKQKQDAVSAAEERLGLEQELQQSKRLAAVGRLAAGVAHELGTPLNVIDARAKQLLASEEQKPETHERYLRIIRAQVKDMTRIVRQLLTLAQPLQLRQESIELRQMIAKTLALLEAEASTGIKIEVTPGAEVTISGDEELLRQTLFNLFRNSVQAMPAGGRLEITVASPQVIKEGREFVAVRIADCGTGIAPEHLEHIFDPFYTTKDIGLGSGLGLSVAGRIVAEHGGWIAAENAAEGGAVFTIYLPTA